MGEDGDASVVTRTMPFVGLVWLLSRTRRLGAVLDSETFGMTSPADLERALPSLQGRFAISVGPSHGISRAGNTGTEGS